MEHKKDATTGHLMATESEENRRREARMDGRFEVTFSGIDKGEIMMDEGQVLNLSREGIGIRADHSLKPGMELALFIELPDCEDHLCISEARVAWVSGHRFGVALRTIKKEDQDRLRHFLWAHQQRRRHGGQSRAQLPRYRKNC